MACGPLGAIGHSESSNGARFTPAASVNAESVAGVFSFEVNTIGATLDILLHAAAAHDTIHIVIYPSGPNACKTLAASPLLTSAAPASPASPATQPAKWMESVGSDTAKPQAPPSPSCDEGGKSATPRPERNSIVPPYWKRHEETDNSVSYNASAETISRPSPIQLEDHTDAGSEQCKALWAKSATIDDYVIVNGSTPGLGSYVVWNCTVETLDVSLFRFIVAIAVMVLHTHTYHFCRLPRLTSPQGGPMKIIKR